MLEAGQIFQIAAARNKFSPGSLGASVSESTFWVVLFYGLVTHMQNFSIDQSYVQRYLARPDRARRGSQRLAGHLVVHPVSGAFSFIGTALFAFCRALPERLPASLDALAKPDAVFPQFIRAELPVGLTGPVIAAICGPSMDSNPNYRATLFLRELYQRYLRPAPVEAESVWVLRLATLGIGAASTVAALAMLRVRTALDVWWQLAGICSGGMLGLFLLGAFSRADGRVALAVIMAGVAAIFWLTLSPGWTVLPVWARSSFHPLLVLVIGSGGVLVVGLAAARIRAANGTRPTEARSRP